MSTKQTSPVDDIWDRHAIDLIGEVFGAVKIEDGAMPLTAAEAVAELLASTRELIGHMRKTEPKRMTRKGWIRVAEAIASCEKAIDGHVDIDELLEDWADGGRATDPHTSTKAASVASIGSGSARFHLMNVYFKHPEGLTADEAVREAELMELRNPWRRVYDLKGMGVLTKTGEERETTAGAQAEVLVLTEQARGEWGARMDG